MLGPLQVLQNTGQQQNQQQTQGQQHPQGQQGGLPAPPPPQNGQDFTLSSVLHFLQTEWRRYERDRNEWEIERAEMRARIALLEGERRSFENVKLDLMRRIKMLEYALRMERSKQLTQPPSSNPSSKLPSAQAPGVSAGQKDDGQSQRAESGGSSPRSEDSPLPDTRLPNGAVISGPTRPNSWGPGNWAQAGGAGSGGALGKAPPGRDPKSRARSRDYLKQCLQEISYLTSPQAMNPLPNRPILSNPSISMVIPNVPQFESMPYNGRPRKMLPETGKEFPILNGMTALPGPSTAHISNISHSQNTEHPSGHIPQPLGPPSSTSQTLTQESVPQPPDQQQEPPTEKGVDNNQGVENSHGTAIFQPGKDWKEKLKQAHDRGSTERQPDQPDPGSWEEEPSIEDEEDVTTDGEGSKVWKPKKTLRNHLDAVRAVAFHPTELCLATGGDDCTVKIWRMEVSTLASSNARPTTEVEPQLTLRGHSAAITHLIHSPSKGLLYSASLDLTIRVWALPASTHTTYAPYDETRSRGELVGHSDAIWDLALVQDESTLISCGAEGAVKVWDVSGPSGGGSLKLTWGWNGVVENPDDNLPEETPGPGATAVEAIKSDLKKVAVAYQNSVVKIFEIQTGRELAKLNSDISYDGTPNSQINCITSHPTMPLLVTGHEDKYIRVFDISTGQCTHSMLAHLDGVTSLSIDATGFSLVSGSHDCSVRFWDLLGSHQCVQEISSHREKAREGVLDVEFHPSLPFMASAGADGVVKLYASS